MRWRDAAGAVRVGVLLLCTALTLISPRRWHDLPWLAAVAALAGAGWMCRRTPRLVVPAAVVEAVLVVVAVLLSGAGSSPLLPALLAPAYVAGVAGGFAAAAAPPAAAALALAAGGVAGDRGDRYAAAAATWVALAAGSGLVGAGSARLGARTTAGGSDGTDASYAAAYRLLTQLRPVARRLSVGLEPATIAEGLLESLRPLWPFDRAAVFVRGSGSRLVPLAVLGAPRVDWPVEVSSHSVYAEAWLTQRRQRVAGQLSGGDGSATVVPLVAGVRTFGVVGLECDRPQAYDADNPGATVLLRDGALRLDTALLFDEVRGVATAEERRRLAREIHDGIAQELSYLGYLLDGLAADARSGSDGSLHPQLVELRGEVTRIVRELRMSVYDLRSEVDAHGGLGAALSEYVRSVGRQSGLTVHLSLTEGGHRLPAEAEAELLRIAQEAVTNARKHAGADNLWVYLEVDPPGARLCVEDDGRGLGDPREDSFGLAIMRERAARLGTVVSITPRSPTGTVVEVRLPSRSDRPAAVRATALDRPHGVEELSR